MLTFYKTNEKSQKVEPANNISTGVWINAIDPSPDEITKLVKKTNIPEDFIYYGLDDNESARVEVDDDTGTILIVFDMPVFQKNEHEKYIYRTLPLGIAITNNAIITMNTTPVSFLNLFADNQIAHFDTRNLHYAALQFVYHITTIYLSYLSEINRSRENIEDRLETSLKNSDLFALMEIQRGLVYFIMSLKTNRMVLEKMKRSRILIGTDDTDDLLDDTVIENQQAVEMADISNSIINETADTYSNVINNNLNGVMKFLTAMSIILTIPTAVFSFYGMNVDLPFSGQHLSWMIIIIIALITTALISFHFWHKRYF